MLQRIHDAAFRELPRQDAASALETVSDDVAAALAKWPRADPDPQASPIVRLAASPDGRLAQVAGRTLGRGRASRGSEVTVDGRLVYAVGDIHGCYPLLLGLLSRMSEDAAEVARGRVAAVVFLGDYVDRGPHSARVLEALCRVKASAPFDLCLLKGNHEQALLKFLDAPAEGAPWIGYGGGPTLEAYGVEPPGRDDPPGVYETARDELLRRMPASHLRLLQTLDLMAVIGDYVFVHAGVAPGEPLRGQSERDLLWIRREFLEARQPCDRVVVHGHTWADDQPVVTGARIGVDTGAYETGALTAMRLEDDAITALQVRDPARPAWRRPIASAGWTPVREPLNFTGGRLETGAA